MYKLFILTFEYWYDSGYFPLVWEDSPRDRLMYQVSMTLGMNLNILLGLKLVAHHEVEFVIADMSVLTSSIFISDLFKM